MITAYIRYIFSKKLFRFQIDGNNKGYLFIKCAFDFSTSNRNQYEDLVFFIYFGYSGGLDQPIPCALKH